jgi:hypothetical protein
MASMTTGREFNVSPDTAVVTSTYITNDGAPVLEVTHEEDPEEGTIWQFHNGNGDYRGSVLQLVRLDELLQLDSTLTQMADLPVG